MCVLVWPLSLPDYMSQTARSTTALWKGQRRCCRTGSVTHLDFPSWRCDPAFSRETILPMWPLPLTSPEKTVSSVNVATCVSRLMSLCLCCWLKPEKGRRGHVWRSQRGRRRGSWRGIGSCGTVKEAHWLWWRLWIWGQVYGAAHKTCVNKCNYPITQKSYW